MLRSSDFEEMQSEISKAFTFRETATSRLIGTRDEDEDEDEDEEVAAVAEVVVAEEEAVQR